MTEVFQGSRPQGLSFAAHITILCVLVALPLLLLSGVLLHEAAVSERGLLEESSRVQAREIALLVERDFADLTVFLESIATYPPLLAGDLASFDSRARELGPRRNIGLALFDLSGHKLADSRAAPGEALPDSPAISQDLVRQVVATGQPRMSSLFIDSLSSGPVTLIAVPVLRDGGAAYVLAAVLEAEHYAFVLDGKSLPGGWWAAVIDRNNGVVAHTPGTDRSRGQRLVDEAPSSALPAPSGRRHDIVSLDGVPHFLSRHFFGGEGWSVGVAMPQSLLLAPLRRSLLWFGMMVGLALTSSVGLALIYGRHVAGGVDSLARAAVALGRGRPLFQTVTAVRDINLAAEALVVAERKLAARTQALVAARQEAETARRQAEEASAAKTTFLAAVSHDLRQPFQALRLFLGILEGQAASHQKQVVDNLGKVLSSGEELLAAITDLAVLDAGQIAPRPTWFPLDSLLAEIADECAPLAAAGHLAFRRVETGAWVQSDRALLRRMIRNLVINAIRYTREGGVLIGCRRRGGGLSVQVVDTGIGIPADQRQRIFDAFYQLGKSSRDRSQGLGLGLAIVCRLAALLGHPVRVDSTLGKGSAFSIDLGMISPAAPPVRPPAASRALLPAERRLAGSS